MSRTKPWMLSLALLLSVVFLDGSPAATAAEDWLAVPPEDLALKDNPKGSGADSMILYRESVINASESTLTEYMRIKVFTTRGTQQGDVSIPYERSQSSIRDIRTRTIRPNGEIVNFEGSTYDKTVFKGAGFNLLEKTFSLPNVEPGSIIEYKYVEQYDPSRYISLPWTVQLNSFTRLARFSIKPDRKGGAPPLYFRQSNLPSDTGPKAQPDGTYTLEVRDLPGLEEEPYMPPENTLRARVEFFYRDRSVPNNETTEQFWNRIGKAWSKDLDEFANKKGALSAEVAAVCGPGDSAETKLRKLYARAQRIRNLSFEETKSKKEEKQENLKENANVEDVLKHGYGTSRNVNALFVGLARAAGFQATEIFSVPRDRGVFAPDVQESNRLTNVLVWVRAEGKEYFVDPAARYFPFGLLEWEETGVRGLRLDNNKPEIVSIPLPPSSQAVLIRRTDLEMDDDGVLKGKLQVDFSGLRGAIQRRDEREEDEAGRRNNFEAKIKAWLPPDSTFDVTAISNWEDITVPVRVEGTVKIPALATFAGHRVLMPLSLFEAPQVRSFQPAKRVNDVYFHYPYEEVDEINLRVPPGYRIEILPPERRVSPGVLFYEISARQDGGVVHVKRHLIVEGVMIPVKYYASLRTFFTSVKANDEEQIVLQRTDVAQKN
jgi:hypothetical protein